MDYILAFVNKLPSFLFLIILGLLIFRSVRMITHPESLDGKVKKEFKNYKYNKYRITLFVIMCLVIVTGTLLIANNTEDTYFQLEIYNFWILCTCLLWYGTWYMLKSFLDKYVTLNSIVISVKYKHFYKILNSLVIFTIILTVFDLIVFWSLLE